MATSTIPVEKGLDNTVKLLKEGYRYIPNRKQEFHSDIFKTRLLGQKVICLSGEEAAKVFYDNDLFQRKGATPRRIQKSLFGTNAVQTLDGDEHKHRKQLFMSLMSKENLERLHGYTNEQWQVAIESWQQKEEVILFEEAKKIMCRTACQWTGVPLYAKELQERSDDLAALVDGFGAAGPRHWQARLARKKCNRWIAGVIERVRTGELKPAEDTGLYAMAWHRGLDGELLDEKMAAIELINILRPIVAIAYYIVFSAIGVHEHPETRKKLQDGGRRYQQLFVQEVRRYYPFGPFTGARVKNEFDWNGHHFKKRTLVLLDIYGTNHDSALWERPDEFLPERFENWNGSPFNFIPQGGGDYHMGHRCAGEWVTIQVMQDSLDFLVNKLDYEVPDQNLEYSMIRMPTIPKNGFVMKHIKLGIT